MSSAVEAIDAEIARHEEQLRQLREARAIIAPIRRRRKRRGSPVSPRRSAGGTAITRVAEVLERVGRTTQAEIVRTTGLNTGTVSHSLAALSEDGKAMKTGRKERNSPEWSWKLTESGPTGAERDGDAASHEAVAV